MADNVYCYPDSDVLINKLDIRELERLHTFEKKLTMLRLLELIDKPINGNFDFKHLKEIHRYIFQDVYDWSGKVRKVDIAKGNKFCNIRFIDSQATEIFGRIKTEKYLAGLIEPDFIKRLAYFFSEINALHPFREGNLSKDFHKSPYGKQIIMESKSYFTLFLKIIQGFTFHKIFIYSLSS